MSKKKKQQNKPTFKEILNEDLKPKDPVRKTTLVIQFQIKNDSIITAKGESNSIEGMTRQEALQIARQFLVNCQEGRDSGKITQEQHELISLGFLNFMFEFIDKADLEMEKTADVNYYFKEFSKKYTVGKLSSHRVDVTLRNRLLKFVPDNTIWSKLINAFNEFKFNLND